MTYKEHRFICLVQDISEKGVFLICNYNLKVGWVLEVRFEMEHGIEFSARIKVCHVDNGCFGAEIVELSPKSKTVLQQFLNSRFVDQSDLPERRVRF